MADKENNEVIAYDVDFLEAFIARTAPGFPAPARPAGCPARPTRLVVRQPHLPADRQLAHPRHRRLRRLAPRGGHGLAPRL